MDIVFSRQQKATFLTNLAFKLDNELRILMSPGNRHARELELALVREMIFEYSQPEESHHATS